MRRGRRKVPNDLIPGQASNPPSLDPRIVINMIKQVNTNKVGYSNNWVDLSERLGRSRSSPVSRNPQPQHRQTSQGEGGTVV
jgi:hypothetical protein